MIVDYMEFIAKLIIAIALTALLLFIIGVIIYSVVWFMNEMYISIHNYRIEKRKAKNGKRDKRS